MLFSLRGPSGPNPSAPQPQRAACGSQARPLPGPFPEGTALGRGSGAPGSEAQGGAGGAAEWKGSVAAGKSSKVPCLKLSLSIGIFPYCLILEDGARGRVSRSS